MPQTIVHLCIWAAVHCATKASATHLPAAAQKGNPTANMPPRSHHAACTWYALYWVPQPIAKHDAASCMLQQPAFFSVIRTQNTVVHTCSCCHSAPVPTNRSAASLMHGSSNKLPPSCPTLPPTHCCPSTSSGLHTTSGCSPTVSMIVC